MTFSLRLKASVAFMAGLSYSFLAQASQADLNQYKTTDFLLATAPTGCQPKGMKVDAKSKYLFVAEMCGRILPETKQRVPSMSVYDMTSFRLERIVQTPAGSDVGILGNTEVEMSANDHYVYVARAEGDAKTKVYPGMGMVTVVDSESLKIAKLIPDGGAGAKTITRRPFLRNDSSEIIYVSNYFSDDISVMDVTNMQNDGNMDGRALYKGKIKLTSAFTHVNPNHGYRIAPRGLAFTNDGKYAIALATETGSLIIIDSVHHRQLIELAPMSPKIAGRQVNVRHIVLTKDGHTAYLGHMSGNGVSRISVDKLIQIAVQGAGEGKTQLSADTWEQILIPFPGNRKFLVLEDYPKDHPNFPGKKWRLAHPNTIALDPVNNRYLYVSFRTTSNANYEIIDLNIKGKVDVLDTQTGQVIFSFVGGAQPTALEVTPDNKTLISAGFKDSTLYFFDLAKLIRIYEN
jgi:DNA-binding beta-propeller fold protein YncE